MLRVSEPTFLRGLKDALSVAEGQSRCDPAAAWPALWTWHNEMCETFPSGDGPRAFDLFCTRATKNATYRFASHAILAGFHWEVSGSAFHLVKKLAMTHGLGLFNASGVEGAVWGMSERGRYDIVHRNEDAEPRSLSATA